MLLDLLFETEKYNTYLDNFVSFIFIRQKSILFFAIVSFLFVFYGNPGIITDKQYSEEVIKKKYKVLNRFKCCQKCHIYSLLFKV